MSTKGLENVALSAWKVGDVQIGQTLAQQ